MKISRRLQRNLPLYKLVIIPAIVVYLVQKFREAGLPAGKGRQRGNKGMDGAKNQSIKELVYEGILNDIIQGVYPANSILNERTLVEKYGVSKTPVREALVQLCGEGILKNIPRYAHAKHAGALAQKRDITTHWATNMEFHLMLCECCSNQFMYKSLNDALKFCSRGASQYFNKSWETGNPTDANGHVQIMEAIRHQDGKLAEELLVKDIECLWNEILGP